MITEDYVSFETAKLLKEKGFIGDVQRWYVIGAPEEGVVTKGFGNETDYAPAPTIQMAMKWLREKHNLSITVFLLNVVDGEYIGYHADIELMDEWIENLNKFKKASLSKTFHSYEQACEAAIKYCLENLI